MMWLLHLDKTITNGMYLANSLNPFWLHVLYYAASVFIYSLPIILLYLFYRGGNDRVKSVKIFLIAVIAWVVLNRLIGDFLYAHYGFRDRPFAQYGIKELFFERPTKAFPSDHAAVIFAATLSFFYYRYRKIGWIFLIGGTISALARVAIGFHWFGDIVGGYIMGLIAFLVVLAFDKQLTEAIQWTFNKLSFGAPNGQKRPKL